MQQDDILQILEESSRQLGQLKEQVQNLVKFFSSILNEVNATVKDVKKEFITRVDNGILTNRAGEVTEVRLSPGMLKVRQSKTASESQHKTDSNRRESKNARFGSRAASLPSGTLQARMS